MQVPDIQTVKQHFLLGWDPVGAGLYEYLGVPPGLCVPSSVKPLILQPGLTDWEQSLSSRQIGPSPLSFTLLQKELFPSE
jgi:hypothetical protein